MKNLAIAANPMDRLKALFTRPSLVRQLRHNAEVGIWDELTPQQYAVMLSAIEEQCLNRVIYEFHARRFWKANGGYTSQPPPPMSEPEVLSLIPQFAEVVTDLITQGWIDIREPWMPWDDAPTMTAQEVGQTLADPDTWIWDEQGGRRMVGLMSTARRDALGTRA